MEKLLYKCNLCDVETLLLPPVDRPCPCGGNLIEVNFFSREWERPDVDKLSDPVIERIVRESMPEILAGFEELLRQEQA